MACKEEVSAILRHLYEPLPAYAKHSLAATNCGLRKQDRQLLYHEGVNCPHVGCALLPAHAQPDILAP